MRLLSLSLLMISVPRRRRDSHIVIAAVDFQQDHTLSHYEFDARAYFSHDDDIYRHRATGQEYHGGRKHTMGGPSFIKYYYRRARLVRSNTDVSGCGDASPRGI